MNLRDMYCAATYCELPKDATAHPPRYGATMRVLEANRQILFCNEQTAYWDRINSAYHCLIIYSKKAVFDGPNAPLEPAAVWNGVPCGAGKACYL